MTAYVDSHVRSNGAAGRHACLTGSRARSPAAPLATAPASCRARTTSGGPPLPSLLSSLPTRRATLLCRSPLCLDLLSARGAARPASDQRRRERGVAREASRGRDGARMACAGVRRASPAGRRAGNGGDDAARQRTVAAGRASMPGALHDKAKGWVRAQTGRGERGGAVGVRN